MPNNVRFPQLSGLRRVTHIFAIALLGTVAFNAYFFVQAPDIDIGTLHLAAAATCLYFFLECRRHVAAADALGLMAPPFLATIIFGYLCFILPVTLSAYDNFILFRYAPLLVEPAHQLTKSVGMMAGAVFCMWRGYSACGPTAVKLRNWLASKSIIRKQWVVRLGPLYATQLISLALVVLSIRLGVYGIASSLEARTQHASLIAWIDIGLAAGTLSLVLMFVHYYRLRSEGRLSMRYRAACLLLLCIHVGVGALSGFKFQLIQPFIVIVLSQFIATQKVSRTIIAVAAGSLIFAYLVVEPYRAHLDAANIRGASNIATLSKAVSEAVIYGGLPVSDVPLGTQIASRFDLVQMTALGMQAKETGQLDEKLTDSMLESIVLAPVLAYVPRFLWESKGSYSTGSWFNRQVVGNLDDETTSVGMGPVAYLYFIGGTSAVLIGFFVIGVVQRLAFAGVAMAGAGGVIIFLALIPALVILPSDIGPALTGILRILPIAVAAQAIFLGHSTHWRPRVSSPKIRLPSRSL